MRSAFYRLAAAALLVPALWAGARAQEGQTVEVSEGSVNVSFTPPPNCQELPAEAYAALAQQGVNLKHGCVTPQKDTAVFLMMVESGGRGEKGLADFERGFRDSQNGLHPGIKWLGRDTVKISGGKWVRLRYREGPAEDNLINHVYLTDWAGEFILFIVGAPASKYERLKAGLERSANSIEASVSVFAPAEGNGPAATGKP